MISVLDSCTNALGGEETSIFVSELGRKLRYWRGEVPLSGGVLS